MSSTHKPKSRLTLAEFKNLVETSSPNELKKITFEQLPLRVPMEIVKEAHPDSQGILEHLLFEANQHELQIMAKIEKKFGASVARALQQGDMPKGATLNKIFIKKVQELYNLNKEWQQERIATLDKKLLEMISDMDKLLVDVRNDSMATVKAYNLLEEQLPSSGEFEERFRAGIAGLKSELTLIDKWLGEYFLIRLSLVGLEMQKTKHRVEELDFKANHIQSEIDDLCDQIEKSKSSWKSKLRLSGEDPRIQELQAEVTKLLEEKASCDVIISENDLTNWLDVIVDVNLSPFSRAKAEKSSRRLRLSLFNLMNKYCALQEEAALQIAHNPLVQTDAELAIKFMLQSEKYILDYFSQKREQLSAWLGNAAKMKLDMLDELEEELIQEMRSNLELS